MYLIFSEFIKFIENIMQNWGLELTAGGKSLTAVKILREIFQEDALSPLLFVIAMMPLDHILRKGTGIYKLHKLQEKNQPPHVHGTTSNCLHKMKKNRKP